MRGVFFATALQIVIIFSLLLLSEHIAKGGFFDGFIVPVEVGG